MNKCILLGYNPEIIFSYFFHKMNLVPQGCLRFVIVVFPDHAHLLFLVIYLLLLVFFFDQSG